MKDERGLFYYPLPADKRLRAYVRQVGGEICFRLWHADDPSLWQAHGWVAHRAILQASSGYRNAAGFDPTQVYDLTLARALLKEGR